MGSIIAFFAGKMALGSILGGGGLAAVGAIFANPFLRKVLLVVAVALIVLAGVAVHAHKVKTFGAERFAAGELKVQLAWDKAVADAKILRAGEFQRAAETLSMADLAQMRTEEEQGAQFDKLNADLERAMAAHPSDPVCDIPGELLAPRRALNPRTH